MNIKKNIIIFVGLAIAILFEGCYTMQTYELPPVGEWYNPLKDIKKIDVKNQKKLWFYEIIDSDFDDAYEIMGNSRIIEVFHNQIYKIIGELPIYKHYYLIKAIKSNTNGKFGIVQYYDVVDCTYGTTTSGGKLQNIILLIGTDETVNEYYNSLVVYK